MANLTPIPGNDTVPQLEIVTPALAGPGGPMNTQAQALLNRIELTKNNLATEVTDRTTAVTVEATTRSTADGVLQANITAEGVTRAAADVSLQTNLTAEATARSAADTTLQTNINTNTANIALKANISDLAASSGSSLVGWIRSAIGAVFRLVSEKLAETVSVKDFGVVGGGKIRSDGVATASSTTFTSAGIGFTSGVNNKLFIIVGAGVAGATLITSATYVNATTVTLAVAPSTSVVEATFAYGVDDAVNIQKAYTHLATKYNTLVKRFGYLTGSENTTLTGGTIIFPTDVYITSTITPNYNCTTDFQKSAIVCCSSAATLIDYSLQATGAYGGEGQEVKNATLHGMRLAKHNFKLEAANWASIENITSLEAEYGFSLHEQQYSSFRNCHAFKNSKVGWHLTDRVGLPGLDTIDNHFTGCSAEGNYIGIWIQESEHNIWDKIDSSRNVACDILLGEAFGGTGTGAVLTPTIAAGIITGITITNGGTGFTSPPIVEIAGDGINAKYLCEVTAGVITTMYKIAGGTGYTTATVTAVGKAATFGHRTTMSVINRRNNVFNSLKVEHNKDDIPTSGYAIWANLFSHQENHIEGSVSRQTSGTGPTAYFKAMRSDAPGNTFTVKGDDSQNLIAAPYNAADFSMYKVTTSNALTIFYNSNIGATDLYKLAVDKTDSTATIGKCNFLGWYGGHIQSDGFHGIGFGTYSQEFMTRIQGEANDRLIVTADGKRQIGPGTSALWDVTTDKRAAVQTANATVTALDAIGIVAGQVITWKALVSASSTDNTSHASYEVTGSFYLLAGVATIIGQAADNTFEMNAAMNATFTVTGASAVVSLSVTGVAAKTINWTSVSTILVR